MSPGPLITSHEDLLAPVLQLLAAKGELRIVAAVQVLTAHFPLPPNPPGHLHNASAPAFQLVASALRSLGAAGLLEPTRPFTWGITDDGRALAQTRPPRITFDTLKQYPAYNQYWAGIARDNLRQKYLDLRFEHYSSGRLLFLQGSHSAAAVLLAYAIEYHLKSALIEVEATWTTEERRLVEREHDLADLYQASLRRGLLTSSYISREFLDYAHDHFERRYPSREQNVMAARGYWMFGGSLLQTYDDCIAQLDLALSEHYDCHTYRLGVHAIAGLGVSPRLVDAFFHGNVFAIEHIPSYTAALPEPSRFNIDASHLDRPDLLLAREGLPYPGFTYARAREVADWNLAAYFRYPRQGEPDPDPARLLAHRAKPPLTIASSKWVIDRVVQAFGYGAVDVTEDRKKDEVLLTVFDRRAKRWHRTLALRRGFVEPLIQNRANEELLERWIEEVRFTFKKQRRNLRVPPKPKTRGA